MKRAFLVAGILIVILGFAAYALLCWLSAHTSLTAGQEVSSASSTADNAAFTVPPPGKTYTNSAHHFSVVLPQGYTAHEMPADANGVSSVVVENGKGDGIQISISPFDEDKGSGYTLTKERILKDLPDLEITDPQTLPITPQYSGLEFKSNSDAFNGSSYELWFVYKGYLYQISTYARLQVLLTAVFSTWKFF